ncbi:MAG: DUF4292 domain-containing protein [Myxococcales bacterium]|nr:DUF4292 domain-containing protein [Myxococcales bacterium]
MRAEARVDYLEERGDRIKLTMTFLIDRPSGGLRIDAESPLGGSAASLASDGKTFQLLDVRNNRFLTGEATACNLARLLRVRLRPADVIDVVTGSVPLLGEPADGGVRWDPADGGHEVLVLRGEGGLVETIHLLPKSWEAVAAEVVGPAGAATRVVYRLENDDFAGENGLRFPTRTQIFDPGNKADARLRFRSREVNVVLPEGVFHLDPPPGLAVETVSCAE